MKEAFDNFFGCGIKPSLDELLIVILVWSIALFIGFIGIIYESKRY